MSILLALSACVSFPNAPQAIARPQIDDNAFVSIDGARLGLRDWQADAPRAVIIALHGMNDYSRAFDMPGAWWAENADLTVYALDQRGFGRSPDFGRWAGSETMIADLRGLTSAVRARHPDLPVYALGHSMGAAVVMAAEADGPLGADGLILAAPGVWGGEGLPLHYRMTLNMAAILAPGKTLTGERAGRQSTDNIEILREMFRDPLVIKQTRIDAILGVVRVMGAAYGRAEDIDEDALVLIGLKDEIIPIKKMRRAAVRMNGETTVREYDEGWHLLLRDLQAERVWRDIAEWIEADIAAEGAPARAALTQEGA